SPPSKPASPNSLTITAIRRPFAWVSSERSSVVLPAPRKPVSTVTGIRDMSTLLNGFAFEPERKSGCDEHDIWNGGGNDLIETSLRVAKAAAERRVRHEAKPDLIGYQNDWMRR